MDLAAPTWLNMDEQCIDGRNLGEVPPAVERPLTPSDLIPAPVPIPFPLTEYRRKHTDPTVLPFVG